MRVDCIVKKGIFFLNTAFQYLETFRVNKLLVRVFLPKAPPPPPNFIVNRGLLVFHSKIQRLDFPKIRNKNLKTFFKKKLLKTDDISILLQK